MLFMVVEHFRGADPKPAYELFKERGRMMPDGVSYVASWIEVGLGRCFQLMETDDLAKLQEWCANWSSVVEFEVVPVIESKDMAAVMNRAIDGESG